MESKESKRTDGLSSFSGLTLGSVWPATAGAGLAGSGRCSAIALVAAEASYKQLVMIAAESVLRDV